MEKFIEWAFYGNIPDELEMTTIYESYKIYCKLFDIEELTKFEFIQCLQKWREQQNDIR